MRSMTTGPSTNRTHRNGGRFWGDRARDLLERRSDWGSAFPDTRMGVSSLDAPGPVALAGCLSGSATTGWIHEIGYACGTAS